MKQRIIYTILLLACALTASSQPKWSKKARKAQINIITYDASGRLLHSTNGFFIDNNGTALTDYHSFRGASRAVVVDDAGKEWPVSCIAGASSLYDVLKIQVSIPKSAALTCSKLQAQKGEPAFIQPYLSSKAAITTETTIADASTFNESYAYYTLPLRIADLSTSCPVMNQAGEVIGLVQMAATAADVNTYAVSADFAQSLTVSALSATASDYRDILIRKALPTEPSQAHTFVFLAASRDTLNYPHYIEDYLRLFPSEANGYILKAEMLTSKGQYAEADAAWDAGIKARASEEELRYSRASTIFKLAQAKAQMPENWTIDRAMTEVETALSINPLPIYSSLKAHLLYAQKQYPQACEQFMALNQTNLRSAENYLYAAQCKLMLSDTTAVLALQDSAVACFTKPYVEAAAPALLMRANTLISLNRNREAVIDLNDYERLKSKDLTANFYYQREQAEMRCRMYQQALDDIERATRMEPREPLFQAEKAALNYRFNQIDEAIAAAQAAIDLDNDFADAYRILGLCLRAQQKETEARAALQRASDLGDPMATQLLTQ